MNTLQKIERLKDLKKEVKSIKKDFQTEMFDYVHQEFRKKGFITDPRGNQYMRSLYNPEMKLSVWIGNITENTVSVNVHDMVDYGMNYSKKYQKLTGPIYFNYLKESFEKFFDSTYSNCAKKLI